jgi:hypothetical protein
MELRYSTILDALAALCVPAPKSDVIAIALQVDLKAKNITLTTASHKPDNVPTDHIYLIWQSLQTISDVYTQQRRKNHVQARAAAAAAYADADRTHYMQWTDGTRSPLMTKANRSLPEVQKPICDFNVALYRFSWKKFQHRFKKADYWKQFEGFCRQYADVPSVQSLHEVLDAIRKVYIIQEPSEVQMNRLSHLMAGLRQLFETVITELRQRFETVNPELEIRQTSNINKFLRFVKKVLYIHANAEILLRFAFSERLQPFLDPSMHFNLRQCSLKPFRSPCRMPPTPEAWERIIREALEAAPINNPCEDAIRALTRDLSDKWRTPRMTMFVHCELVLAVHFREEKKSQPNLLNPVQHIGVSKLSCQACNVFLEVFNSTAKPGDPRFVTRGCHGKSYFPWGFPMLNFNHQLRTFIRSEFIKQMATQFIRQLRNHSRSLSDSTTGSNPDDSVSSLVPTMIQITLAEAANI